MEKNATVMLELDFKWQGESRHQSPSVGSGGRGQGLVTAVLNPGDEGTAAFIPLWKLYTVCIVYITLKTKFLKKAVFAVDTHMAPLSACPRRSVMHVLETLDAASGLGRHKQ